MTTPVLHFIMYWSLNTYQSKRYDLFRSVIPLPGLISPFCHRGRTNEHSSGPRPAMCFDILFSVSGQEMLRGNRDVRCQNVQIRLRVNISCMDRRLDTASDAWMCVAFMQINFRFIGYACAPYKKKKEKKRKLGGVLPKSFLEFEGPLHGNPIKLRLKPEKLPVVNMLWRHGDLPRVSKALSAN